MTTLYQAIVELAIPFAAEKGLDGREAHRNSVFPEGP
jgi:hypothetical protein